MTSDITIGSVFLRIWNVWVAYAAASAILLILFFIAAIIVKTFQQSGALELVSKIDPFLTPLVLLAAGFFLGLFCWPGLILYTILSSTINPLSDKAKYKHALIGGLGLGISGFVFRNGLGSVMSDRDAELMPLATAAVGLVMGYIDWRRRMPATIPAIVDNRERPR